jgi:predicted RNA binding protein YcfA (HicA-like mRNA interferase family)
LEKVFLSAGFRFARQEGSHLSYTKPGVTRPIVIPTYDEVPVSIMKNNLKTAGITRESLITKFLYLADVDKSIRFVYHPFV